MARVEYEFCIKKNPQKLRAYKKLIAARVNHTFRGLLPEDACLKELDQARHYFFSACRTEFLLEPHEVFMITVAEAYKIKSSVQSDTRWEPTLRKFIALAMSK